MTGNIVIPEVELEVNNGVPLNRIVVSSNVWDTGLQKTASPGNMAYYTRLSYSTASEIHTDSSDEMVYFTDIPTVSSTTTSNDRGYYVNCNPPGTALYESLPAEYFNSVLNQRITVPDYFYRITANVSFRQCISYMVNNDLQLSNQTATYYNGVWTTTAAGNYRWAVPSNTYESYEFCLRINSFEVQSYSLK